ncbi:DUF1064 domain-containing protein [Tateyamaria sp.]|uniref:DUF1064 domain-containing protein n=1 Tax=Tateyamaria sp. TaxID=1929288 RepID=UPI003B221BB4
MNKFGAIATTVDGIRFDSVKEARRWGELRLLEKAGEIRNLQRQVRIPLEGRDGPLRHIKSNRAAVYVADFVYFDCRLGVEVIEDSKGVETDVFKLKRAILAAQGKEVVLT